MTFVEELKKEGVPLCENCGANPAQPLHDCPYDEISSMDPKPCNCCKKCEHECSMEI